MAARTNIFGVGVSGLTLAKLLTEPDSGKPTYGSALDVSTTNAVNYTPTTANATADGDNVQVANITTVTACAVEWTGWGVPDATYAVVYGHTVDSDTSETLESFSDTAPFLGMGYIRKFLDSTGTPFYKGYWYYKVQAVPGNEEQPTQGTNLALNTTTVTFNGMQPANYSGFRSTKKFDTEAEAQTWIDSFLGSESTT